MAIDYGISSLDTGALDIKYTGDEGPKSPKQIAGGEYNRVLELLEKVREGGPLSEEEKIELQQLIQTLTAKGINVEELIGEKLTGDTRTASADPMLQDEYDKYVFELQEMHPEAVPMSIEQFKQQAVSSMANGGIARLGYANGQLVKPGKSDLRISAGLLKKAAPDNHLLAYITPNERDMLIQAGGSGHITKSGIPSFYVGEGMDLPDATDVSAPSTDNQQDFPEFESGSPQNTLDVMPEEMANRVRELTQAQREVVLGDHGDPLGNPEEQAKYARYVKYTLGNQTKKEERAKEGNILGTFNKINYNRSMSIPGAKKRALAKALKFKNYLKGEGVDVSKFDYLKDMDYKDWGFEDYLGIKNLNPDGQMDYANWNLVFDKNPTLITSGNLGSFHLMSKPKGAIDPKTGLPFTRTGWELFKQDVITARGLPTGQDEGSPEFTSPGFSPEIPPVVIPPDNSWDVARSDLPYDRSTPTHDFSGKGFYGADGGRAGYANGGGIRQRYLFGGLGKLFKKITKPFKKFTKSKAGKLAIMAALGYFGGGGGIGSFQGWGGAGFGGSPLAKMITGGGSSLKNLFTRQAPTASWLKEAGLEAGKEATEKYLAQDWWKRLNPWTTIGIPSLVGGAWTAMNPEKDEDEMYNRQLAKKRYWLDRFGPDWDVTPGDPLYQRGLMPAADGGRIGDAGGYNVDDEEEDTDYVRAIRALSYRPRAQEGGLMDMGGMEKDYRNDGGFVPIGGQERADDVPARLSKNEFVFTADAVRAAGGGDIDAGAEVMENVMENLEQGGEISQRSQGLEGARNMFATAKRLEGVL